MLSIIIPARNEKFLGQTVNELLQKATGQIEVIAVLDGYWPDPPLPDDSRLKVIHFGRSRGMRAAINAGVAIATGEFIMKIDGHCMLDHGYDEKLQEDCDQQTVVIPRRKRLDADLWQIQDVGKPDVDYEYLSFPDDPKDFGGAGLNGKIWTERINERKALLIDENMSFQGSCWFMHKSYFHFLELMDEGDYGPFWNEAQEIGLKAWLSGGRVIVNKKTWYAHLHKGKKHGRGYRLEESALIKGAEHTKKWMTQKNWRKQTLPLSSLIERFWPVPTWTDEGLKQLKAHEDTLFSKQGDTTNHNSARAI